MSISVQELNARIADETIFINDLLAEINKVIVGQPALIERVLTALLADGHILLEGVPGLAKTLLIKTTAEAIHAHFARIQFTPDLLPADLMGTQVYNPQLGIFAVHRGPIFANLLLADEINRAPAKVQSALLEAMQERQVTIAGKTDRLPEPLHGHGDAESHRAGRHVSAARSAGRSLHVQAAGRLSRAGR